MLVEKRECYLHAMQPPGNLLNLMNKSLLFIKTLSGDHQHRGRQRQLGRVRGLELEPDIAGASSERPRGHQDERDR